MSNREIDAENEKKFVVNENNIIFGTPSQFCGGEKLKR